MSPPIATTLVLTAPLSGVLVPIEQVPDPVFAQKMAGEGVAIDPVSQSLLAPCDGRVVQLHSAGHAVTVATTEGVEVMMHIGLDTVTLKGAGFTPRVRNGDIVLAGETLIEFDARFVATHARSLLTQIVITNGDRVSSVATRRGHVTAGRDPILELTIEPSDHSRGRPVSTARISESIVVSHATGLHARPAAAIAATARKYRAVVRLRRGSSDANAKSLVAIMGLEVNRGDKICVVADGPDAPQAIAALTAVLRHGLSDKEVAASALTSSPIVREAVARAVKTSTGPDVLAGVAASSGVAVGNVFQVRQGHGEITEHAGDAHTERRRLDAALERAKRQLAALQARLQVDGKVGGAAIFAAHAELLEDPELVDVAQSAIEKGRSAAFAWQRATSSQADRLARLRNPLLVERANDLRDVGRRVLRLLVGAAAEPPEPPVGAILVAEDLSPSDLANLDRSKVLGFCTTCGGATSHVAILAQALGIPAAAGIDPRALELPDGTPVILDGTSGTLRLNPAIDEIEHVRLLYDRHAGRGRADLEKAQEPALTLDGYRVEVAANVGSTTEAGDVLRLGGDGVGLLRSEFLFLDRIAPPTEEEQAAIYQAVAQAVGGGHTLAIRTLDAGGDKPLSWLPMPAEENPFLGERGIRLMLNRPDLLRTQLRAILRVATRARLRVMFPMVATLAEWRAARALLEQERDALGAAPVEVGIMVEVPATAIVAEQFAREVDFFSIGTNDLTQYTLAMDRGHPTLAPRVDGLDPAVLRLIETTVEAAHRHGRRVSVCGGVAGDPQGVPLLVGLGVDELSVAVPAIPRIKGRIRSLSLAACRELAARALAADGAAEVRALVSAADAGQDR